MRQAIVKKGRYRYIYSRQEALPQKTGYHSGIPLNKEHLIWLGQYSSGRSMVVELLSASVMIQILSPALVV